MLRAGTYTPSFKIICFIKHPDADRDAFFRDLLMQLVPCDTDDVSALFQQVVQLDAGAAAAAAATATDPRQQLPLFWAQFRTWDDAAKNGLMDRLEAIDIARVYQFYQVFSSVRWR